MDCSTLGFPILYHLPELAQTPVHWVSEAIQPSPSWSYPSPPAFGLSQHQGLFQGVGSLHQVVKVLELQLQYQSCSEYSGLISLQSMGLCGLLQRHSSKASVIWCSAFFMVQFSHLYMTTRKTITLTIQTFVWKVMSPLFNRLSRFVIAFLPRNKSLLISELQSWF